MLTSIPDLILSLRGWSAILVVFLVPALEASAFVGFIFPGEIAVLLGGVLAYQGRVPLWAAIVAAVAGAAIGDSVGYFIGKRWGHAILRGTIGHLPIIKHHIDKHLEQAQAYVKRRGPHAILVGRFTAALRVMVPGLAGMSEVPYRTFVVFNVIGAVLWGAGFVLLGFFGGAAWDRVAGYASKVGLALLALVLIGLIVVRFLRSMRERGETIADQLADIRPVRWLRERFPTQSAWLAQRVDPGSPRGFLLSLIAVAGAICAWIFIGLTQDVLTNEEAVRLDPGFERFVVSHRAPWATEAMRGITWLGSNAVLLPLVVAVGGYFLWRRRDWRPALLLAAALGGANVLYDIVKPLVGRPRPPASLHLISVSGFAFPSGHATAVIACWGMVAIVLGARRPVKRKVFLWLCAMLITSLVGFSRIYLGVHWWTDVVGGLALGGLWLCALGLVIVARGRGGAPANAPMEEAYSTGASA